MKQNSDYTAQTIEIKEYFDDYGIQLTENFDIKIAAEELGYSVQKMTTIICNLEDTNIMLEVASGNYENVDIDNAQIFNDSYYEMCEYLNL